MAGGVSAGGRAAKISEVYPAEMAARVTFDDCDGVVSEKLPIICQGSSKNKHYWLPDVGEQVVVIEAADGGGAGWIIGSYYSDAVPPKESKQDIRKIEFADGSFIEFDKGSGNLTIQCKGIVRIKGKGIYLNK